jgi:NADH-quinone oxidoreductase subunit L
MVFVTFFGSAKMQAGKRPGFLMTAPVVVLAFLSVIAGFLELPQALGNVRFFTDFLAGTFPAETAGKSTGGGSALMAAASAVSLAGIFAAFLLFLKRRHIAERMAGIAPWRVIHRFWFSGWGFDWLYGLLFVRPFIWIARTNKDDFIDLVYLGVVWLSGRFNSLLSLSQNGKMRIYAAGIAFGAVIVIAIAVFL